MLGWSNGLLFVSSFFAGVKRVREGGVEEGCNPRTVLANWSRILLLFAFFILSRNLLIEILRNKTALFSSYCDSLHVIDNQRNDCNLRDERAFHFAFHFFLGKRGNSLIIIILEG